MKPADRNTRLRSSLILVAGAMIWGFAFVSQSVGARYVEAGTFLAFRSWIAVLFLLPVTAVVSGMRKKATTFSMTNCLPCRNERITSWPVQLPMQR